MFAPRPDTGSLAWVIAVLMHLAVLAAGAFAFARLARRMARAAVPDPPVVRLFVLLGTYLAWLLVGMTSFFWYWSAAASLALAYLLLVAPLFALGIAVTTFRRRAASPYRGAAFWAAVLYAPVAAALWVAVASSGPGAGGGGGATPFYYYDGEPIFLRLDPTRIVVATDTTLRAAEVGARALGVAGVPVDSATRLAGVPGYAVLYLPRGTSPGAAAAARARLRRDRRFTFVSPAYRTARHGGDLLLINRVMVRFRPGVIPPLAHVVAASVGARAGQATAWPVYYLECFRGADPLRVAAALYKHPLVEWADVDRVSDARLAFGID